MNLTSPAFRNNGNIPESYTCDGGNVNPQLNIENIPQHTQALVLIMDDPDAPGGTFTHWTVWNISPRTSFIKEESVPSGGIEGVTSFGKSGYGGPCPPPGNPHRYFFKVYALEKKLELPESATKEDIEKELESGVLEKTELVGIYQR